MIWVLLVALVALAVYVNQTSKKAKAMLRSIPGPSPILPIIGNAHLGIFRNLDMLLVVNDLWNDFGNRSRAFIFNHPVVLFTHPRDTEVIFNSPDFIDKSEEYAFLYPWLGTGLLTSQAAKWKKHRKVITPAFHFRILENFVHVFNDQSKHLVEKLKTFAVTKEAFDVFPLIALYTLDVICETAMGVSVNAQNDSESEYVKALKTECDIVINRMTDPIKRLDFLFRFSNDYKKQEKALSILHGFTDKMINERRNLLLSTQETFSSYTNETGLKNKMAFLDLLLLSKIDGKPLDDISIREEVDTFLFEGHDTTTSALSFALYLLSNNPEVQAKAFEEQKHMFGDDKSRPATHSELQDMIYLGMVIKESLRLYPSVPVLGRKIYKDKQINDLMIPAGTSIVISVFNSNRDPELFPDPEKFIPERFTPEDCSKRSPFASIPFSAGSRNCIGQKFATLEMKANLSCLLRNFEILPSGIDVDLASSVVLKSNNGVNIKIRAR